MRVLVTGATGFIGSHLVDALLAHDHTVIAGVRDIHKAAERFPGVQVVALDVTVPLPAEWQSSLRNVDVVVNTVGIIAESGRQTFEAVHGEFPHDLFNACELAGVRRVIQISALGAGATAISRYHLSKHTADIDLLQRDIEKVIVKPSLVYGARGASTAFFRALAAQPFQLLISGGRQRVQPIYIADLVAALLQLIVMDKPPVEVPAVGPKSISLRKMLTSYRQWLGYGGNDNVHLRSISLPYPVVLASAYLAGFLRHPFFNADNIRMLQQGNTASAVAVSQLLGRTPVSFQQALKMMPAAEADRWHARLYFLVPMLRWSIAFVWIYTGVISAGVYPAAQSYAMLREVGLSGWLLPVSLYGAAMLDILIGIAVLLRYRVYAVGIIQLAVIGIYTLIISCFLPEFWFHPFGPIIKNIPFIMVILIMLAVERKVERK